MLRREDESVSYWLKLKSSWPEKTPLCPQPGTTNKKRKEEKKVRLISWGESKVLLSLGKLYCFLLKAIVMGRVVGGGAAAVVGLLLWGTYIPGDYRM